MNFIRSIRRLLLRKSRRKHDRIIWINVECQPVIDGDVCLENIEQERGTHLYNTKQG